MTDPAPPADTAAPAAPADAADSTAPGRPLPSRGAAALSGVVAAAAALATGELVAALTAGTPSPLVAVGTAVIDFAPPGSKEVIVALFGTNDKIALNLLVAATVLAAGARSGSSDAAAVSSPRC